MRRFMDALITNASTEVNKNKSVITPKVVGNCLNNEGVLGSSFHALISGAGGPRVRRQGAVSRHRLTVWTSPTLHFRSKVMKDVI